MLACIKTNKQQQSYRHICGLHGSNKALNALSKFLQFSVYY